MRLLCGKRFMDCYYHLLYCLGIKNIMQNYFRAEGSTMKDIETCLTKQLILGVNYMSGFWQKINQLKNKLIKNSWDLFGICLHSEKNLMAVDFQPTLTNIGVKWKIVYVTDRANSFQ